MWKEGAGRKGDTGDKRPPLPRDALGTGGGGEGASAPAPPPDGLGAGGVSAGKRPPPHSPRLVPWGPTSLSGSPGKVVVGAGVGGTLKNLETPSVTLEAPLQSCTAGSAPGQLEGNK